MRDHEKMLIIVLSFFSVMIAVSRRNHDPHGAGELRFREPIVRHGTT
jgi:hypothetical protein